jgi:peptide/nickel transport system permease protein
VEEWFEQLFQGRWRGVRRGHFVLVSALVAAAWVALPLVVTFANACIVHASADGAPLLRAPSLAFFLGTDTVGRSEALRLVFAVRTSVSLALPATLLATLLAVPLGAASAIAAAGGTNRTFSLTVDDVLTFALDALLALPFVLVIAAAAALSDEVGPIHLIAIMTFASVPATAKLVRDRALFLHASGYVQAAHALGAGSAHVLASHLLPRCFAFALALAPSTFAQLVVAEAALGYLGLGLPPPAATLGSMLADGQDFFAEAPWLIVAPTLALVALVLAAEGLARALRRPSGEADHG